MTTCALPMWTIALSIPLSAALVQVGHAQTRPEADATGSAEDASESRADRPDFDAIKARGALASRYLANRPDRTTAVAPESDLASFRRAIEPVLESSCVSCHGPDRQRGGLRVDTLDPDLIGGDDVDWWVDVLSVLSNGEMPPPDEDRLSAEERGRVIEWIAAEVQVASRARRSAHRHSNVRRMTRYEYEYALQDLLGLPFAFADDLPPDPISEGGFQNSSESLHVDPTQLRAYFGANRDALLAATVPGEAAAGPAPEPLLWDISMESAAAAEFSRQDQRVATVRREHADDPERLESELGKLRTRFARRPGGAHYESLTTGRVAGQTWHYNGAKFAWAPVDEPSLDLDSADEIERAAADADLVAVIPRRQGMILELGNRIPDAGTVRLRVLASRADGGEGPSPSLRLAFGWRASNDSRAVVRASGDDHAIDALPGAPEVYEFRVPMSEVTPRNGVRHTAKMGGLPSPSEYFKLVNASRSAGAIRVHHVEITAPFHEQWPPASHTRIFPPREDRTDETSYARAVLEAFMTRAWRGEPSAFELRRKLDLYERLRAKAPNFESAMIDVLASVLSSPRFLYVGLPANTDASDSIATRLAMFLWCSTPDRELLTLEESGELTRPDVLSRQVGRMLDDPRSERFSRHFVRQWLGLSLLDYLDVERRVDPEFDADLRSSMAREPVAFFREVLEHDLSVLEFLHADFVTVDERLAEHYGLEGVTGNEFRRVAIDELPARGGLLTQAGLLAMNSDGTDSHPLKRGVWMLERLLDDPPPPPPPAVPEIDLADPEVAKMTLKERIEDHRNDQACMSCHAKIDPWGIALENFGATGRWRTEVQGRPIDATSVLFNGQHLDGANGLKAYLLEERQDQFVGALVRKLGSFALGRPLSFEDEAAVERITAEVRAGGDGLATMIEAIATSELFRTD